MKRSGTVVDANNLNNWAKDYGIPQWVVEIFQKNNLLTVESIGKFWVEDADGLIKLLRRGDLPITSDLSGRLSKGMAKAETHYQYLLYTRKQIAESKLKDQMHSQQPVPSDSTTSVGDFTENSKGLNGSGGNDLIKQANRDITRRDYEEKEHYTDRKLSGDGIKVPAGTDEIGRIEYNETNTRVLTKDPAPPKLSQDSVVGTSTPRMGQNTPREPREFDSELQKWLTQYNVSTEVQEGFREENIFSLEALISLSEDIIASLSEKLKAIPRKKFISAIKELKNPSRSGDFPSNTSSSVQSPAISGAAISTHPVTLTICSPAEIPPPPPAAGGDPDSDFEQNGDAILIATEGTLSIEELKKLLEYENTIIESLIDQTITSRHQFSDKAYEVMNQAKLDHQDRAKRIKRLIQEKRNSTAPPTALEIERPLLERADSVPPVQMNTDPRVKVKFAPEVVTRSLFGSFKTTKDHIRWEKLKQYDITSSNKPRVATSITPAAGMAGMKIDALPQKSDPAVPTWECSMCKKQNTMDLVKCRDCFTMKSGVSTNRDIYNYDGRKLNYQQTRTCKECRINGTYSTFCDNCIRNYEADTRRAYNGGYKNCQNCGQITIRDSYCTDCGKYYSAKAAAKPTSILPQFNLFGSSTSSGSGIGGGGVGIGSSGYQTNVPVVTQQPSSRAKAVSDSSVVNPRIKCPRCGSVVDKTNFCPQCGFSLK